MPTSLASALLLAASFALPKCLAQDGGPIVVEAVRFKGWEKCNAAQQKTIEKAFDDAIDISNYIYATHVDNQIDWHGQAEAEFFGPEYLNGGSQGDIKNVLYQVSTYDRPYWFNPSGYWIHVRCDDFMTMPGRGPGELTKCQQSSAAAYTANKDNPAITDKLPAINFCPNFFTKLKDCKTVIAKWKDSKIAANRLDLINYQCQGYAFLHELFHLKDTSDHGNQGLIKDLNMVIFDRDFQKNRTIPAYSPMFTKILARYPNNDVGKYVSTNADNYAQYSLAKYVQNQITGKEYPKYPIADNHPIDKPWSRNRLLSFENGILTTDNFTALQEIGAGPLTPTIDTTGTTCDDADPNSPEWCDTNPPVVFSSFSKDTTDFYNANPADDQTAWQDVAAASDASLPADNTACFASNIDTSAQPFATRDDYLANIATFCSHAENYILADSQPSSNMSFPLKTSDWSMYVGAAWQQGDPACAASGAGNLLLGGGEPIDPKVCQTQLQSAVDNCDTGSTSQKFGGYTLDKCVVWLTGVNGEWASSSAPPPPTGPTKLPPSAKNCDCNENGCTPESPDCCANGTCPP